MLGDIILQRNAYTCLTTTLNNLGLIKKSKGKYNDAAKYLKQTLDLERAVL
jgi:Tfp pilus assembly protein PilF